ITAHRQIIALQDDADLCHSVTAALSSRLTQANSDSRQLAQRVDGLTGLDAQLAASIINAHRQILALQEAVASGDGVTPGLSSRLTQVDSDSRQLAQRVDGLTGLGAALGALTISNTRSITKDLVQ